MSKPKLNLTMKRNSGRGNEELQRLISLGEVEEVYLDLVDRDEHQPRPLEEVMEGIEEFADEIERDNFVLAQLPVYHIEDNGRRTIVVGERRTTAFRLKGLETIPAICKRFTDAEREQIFILQYVENDGKLKKELSPIADARWWRSYADRYHGGKLSEAAKARGRTPAEVSNRVSLLDADPVIQEFVQRADLKDPATYAGLVRLKKHGNLRMVEQVINDFEAGAIRGSFRNYVELLARDTKASKLAATAPSEPQTQADEITDEERQIYSKAVAFVKDSGRQTISALQREFRIGYNRAARLIERMRDEGVIVEFPHNNEPANESPAEPEPNASEATETCAKALTRSMFDDEPDEPTGQPASDRGRKALWDAADHIENAGTSAARLLANTGSGKKLHYDRVLSEISDAIKALEQSQAAYTAERTALLAKD